MSTETLRILLIEDDEGDALLTRALLTKAAETSSFHFDVDWVDTYGAGLETALETRHDLVLVDYQLCPGSGLDLVRLARERGCRTPFVLLTGRAERSIDQQALDAGAADFLPKDTTDCGLLERSIRYSLRNARTLAALEKKTRELERSNIELEQFARAVSHDLRQPLHVIAGYVEQIAFRFDHSLDDQARDMMARILAGVDRMNRMIEDLLGLARLDMSGGQITEVNLETLLDKVTVDLAYPPVVSHEPLPTVRGRAAHLEQLLRNLLDNARKFSDEESLRVSVTGVREPGRWRIQVADNGTGVPDLQRESIFEPFRRAHAGDRYPGTGVGLALCSKIVQQHGGRIWMEPAHGGGSVFCFTLADSP